MMAPRTAAAFLIVFACGMAEVRPSAGQDPESTPPAAALRALEVRPRVTVSVSQESHVVSSALDIYVELTNLRENDFTIERVELALPGAVDAARGDTSVRAVTDKTIMNPGHVRLVRFKLDHRGGGLFAPIANPQLMTFTPGSYQARVVISFSVPPGKETTVTEIASFDLEPPLSSLLWGGVVGSLLLAAFMSTYRWVRRKGASAPLLRSSAAVALAGVVCAIIALILLRRLQGVDLPVNLTVTDFYGGVIIGLFSYQIGDWLYEQLFGEGS